MCWYTGSLVDRDFKSLAQVAPFVLVPYIDEKDKPMWLALSKVILIRLIAASKWLLYWAKTLHTAQLSQNEGYNPTCMQSFMKLYKGGWRPISQNISFCNCAACNIAQCNVYHNYLLCRNYHKSSGLLIASHLTDDYGQLTPIGVTHAQMRKGGRPHLASAAYVRYDERSGQLEDSLLLRLSLILPGRNPSKC